MLYEWKMALFRGILWCVATVLMIKVTDGVPIAAFYPLTKSTQGKDVIGQNNDIQFSKEPQTWVKGPTGVPGTAKSLCTPSDYEGIMGIDNHDRRLSFKPSMSFFMYIKHYREGPIMEYDTADTSGPAELPGDWDSFYTVPALELAVKSNDPTALFFNMGQASPSPWFSSGSNKLTLNQWQHVGFTFDDATKAFKFWVNGAVVSTKTLSIGLAGSTDRDRIRLGYSYRADYRCLKSDMSCVSFHDVALTEEDVEELLETCRDYADSRFHPVIEICPSTSLNPLIVGLLAAFDILATGSAIGFLVFRKATKRRLAHRTNHHVWKTTCP